MLRMTTVVVLSVLIGACSFVTPTCRQAVGPVELNVQADMAGGTVIARIDEGGSYQSYPMPETGGCSSSVIPVPQ